jgi:hypothetical protein
MAPADGGRRGGCGGRALIRTTFGITSPEPVLPSAQPALTVQLLADRAAAAALASPAVSAGQWVYEVTENTSPGRHPAGVPYPFVQDGWVTADGTLNYDAGSIGDPIFPYNKLGSLPRDPAKLDAYFVSQDPVKTETRASWRSARSSRCCSGWCCRLR